MQRALALARQALWLTSPNPRVGCVITAADGRVIGEGHTQRAGGPHAEIMALQDAQARGHGVRGASAWVTLEPCAHQGRTGPCCDALAAAGIGRVVAALTDPNPRVAGQGLSRLRAAGVEVTLLPATAPLAVQAREALEAAGIGTAVVSMPCWELFDQQDAAYRRSVLGAGVRVGIEAAVRQGWDAYLGIDGGFVGMRGFGASGPADELYTLFNITPQAVVAEARRLLAA